MTEPDGADIAIVGMAGRFPGAPDVDALWERVRDGDDCIADLDRRQLVEEGEPRELVRSAEYVARSGILDDVAGFDPGFFGIGQRDAAIMDPQQRHFMECAWAALESSGHVPESFGGAIGVFAGCGANTYMLNNLLTNPDLLDQVGWFLLRHTANDKDFLTTTTSYRLDLRGPSVNVQTACSTSLVAVHLAVQSLLAFECDLALAGGSTIEVPHGRGYRYMEGEILSPDGVCRAFDAHSAGTVLTSGAGVVALRRLEDAIADRDPILAVVKGTAVNNDGARKVGYLAPSVEGHAEVVKEALAVAGLGGRDIQLVEAHGTGTAVGDPIEVAALTEAFRASTDESGFCRLVSTKPNIGHLDTAAGVASLIKVVQALRHRTLPPLANHTAASPLLQLDTTPFLLSADASPWPGDAPRRAGVSSLGVGGTNAHVIVEEAPTVSVAAKSRSVQVVCLSGRTPQALAEAAEQLARVVDAEPEIVVGDIAFTQAVGRRVHGHRRIVVADDRADLIAQLRGSDPVRSHLNSVPTSDVASSIVFMFPGGGAQYAAMGAGLDERFDVFHTTMAAGIARVVELGGPDLTPLLRLGADGDALRAGDISLPSVFLVSTALARQWMAWGVEPDALIGHSLGEYVSAHLAGVMTFDDALTLVVVRSRLMEKVSGSDAAMLVVPLSEADLRDSLPAGLSLATVNAADECVVAGRLRGIEQFERELSARGIQPSLIPLSVAAHSEVLDPILPDFYDVVRGVSLQAPTRRYVSNLTGTWITAAQATDPQYWVDHLRNTVRFADGLATLLAERPTVLVEMGPGHALSSYARRIRPMPVAAIPVLRHPNQPVDDNVFTLAAFGKQWAAGARVDVSPLAGEGRRRLRLPTYPFQHERCWIDPGSGRGIAATRAPVAAGSVIERIADLDDTFWIPGWTERLPATAQLATGSWILVGSGDDDLVVALQHELASRGHTVEITDDLDGRDGDLTNVAIVGPPDVDVDDFDGPFRRWLVVASEASRCLGAIAGTAGNVPTLALVTRGATGSDGHAVNPLEALAVGIASVAPKEYADLRALMIDTEHSKHEAARVVDELLNGADRLVAIRGERRLVPEMVRRAISADDASGPAFRRGGRYLVTGGLGGVGFVLAKHLAVAYQADLAVVSTEPVPEGNERQVWLARHAFDDPTSRRIRHLAELESLGVRAVHVCADLADRVAVVTALEEAERLLGPLTGAIHAAGQLRDGLIELSSADDHAAVVGAKAFGAVALASWLTERGAELLVLISSTSTYLAPEGQASYVAANSVLDALAGDRGGLRVVTVGSGLWSGVGVAADATRRAHLELGSSRRVEHPVFGELSRDSESSVTVIGVLDSAYHWLLDEHRLRSGVSVLPGTGHIELHLSALMLAGIEHVGLRSVVLYEPLVASDGVPVRIRVSIETDGDDRSIRLESDAGRGLGWRLHSEARVVEISAVAPSALAPAPSADPVTLDVLARTRRHLDLGPRWDGAHDVHVDAGFVCGQVRLADAVIADADAWILHPALLDVATGFATLLADDAHLSDLLVPVGYDLVVTYHPLPADVTVVATVRADSSSATLLADLQLLGAAGEVLAVVEGLQLHRIADADVLRIGDRADEEDALVGAAVAASPLVEVADRLGIQATEGTAMLDRIVLSGCPRVVASTVDLEDLTDLVDTANAATGVSTNESAPVSELPTGSSVAVRIAAMWSDLLGLSQVDPDADFFELGGHSLIAIRLMTRMHRELGVRLQLAAIFEAPTINHLAAMVLAERPELDLSAIDTAVSGPAARVEQPSTPARSLVPISTKGDKAPIFVVHGAGGNVLFLSTLARALGGERPIYGFQAHGIDGADMPDSDVETIASRYVAELRDAHPGPYVLGGYSGGGLVALEMVRQLQLAGDVVRMVLLFDSVPPGRAFPGRVRRKLYILRNAVRHGPSSVRPYLRYVAKSWYRRFVPTAGGQAARDFYEHEVGVAHEGTGYINLFPYFSAVAERYTATSYDVDVVVFKAQHVWPTQRDDYYWTPHVAGHLAFRLVPGDHDSMFFPENVPYLAQEVREVLAPLDAEIERTRPR